MSLRRIFANPVRDLPEAIDSTQRPQPVGHLGGFLQPMSFNLFITVLDCRNPVRDLLEAIEFPIDLLLTVVDFQNHVRDLLGPIEFPL